MLGREEVTYCFRKLRASLYLAMTCLRQQRAWLGTGCRPSTHQSSMAPWPPGPAGWDGCMRFFSKPGH